MKLLLLTCLLLTSISASAQQHPFMSVKERLRILLWIEGIESEGGQEDVKSVDSSQAVDLPEELERALQKM